MLNRRTPAEQELERAYHAMRHALRTIEQIITDAGGPKAIAEAAQERGGKLSSWAPRKWPQIGIPDRHWPLVIELAGATTQELYEANRAAREDAA